MPLEGSLRKLGCEAGCVNCAEGVFPSALVAVAGSPGQVGGSCVDKFAKHCEEETHESAAYFSTAAGGNPGSFRGCEDGSGCGAGATATAAGTTEADSR